MQAQQRDENSRRIAHAFVAARQSAGVVPDYPGTFPASLDDAYHIQDAAIALHDAQIAGWKVGRINPPIDGIDRLSGPIFTARVFDYRDDPVPMAIFADGFGAAEAEFLIRIRTTPDPAKTAYTVAEAVDLIDAVHIGIEIASSPFPGINDNGALATISDFGNNYGLVVGAAIDGWRDIDLNAMPVELHIDDTIIGKATAATMLDGPIGAARFLFEHLAKRGIGLKPGQWISSGAVTGVHKVDIGDRVEVRFGDSLKARCTIDAA